MSHVIDGTCCQYRGCNKCDEYRIRLEKLQVICELQSEVVEMLEERNKELHNKLVKAEKLSE